MTTSPFSDLPASEPVEREPLIEPAPPADRMLKWFDYGHLPANLQIVSKGFHLLALDICFNISPGPERTVALRKLLESKDAAVRAQVHPFG